MLLVGCQEGHPACKKTDWWGAGMVIYLEWGANCLHMTQLMLLPLSLASVKSRLVIPFWYRLTRVILDKGPLNRCVCVCLCVCVCVYTKYSCPELLKSSYTCLSYSYKCWGSFFETQCKMFISVCAVRCRCMTESAVKTFVCFDSLTLRTSLTWCLRWKKSSSAWSLYLCFNLLLALYYMACCVALYHCRILSSGWDVGQDASFLFHGGAWSV